MENPFIPDAPLKYVAVDERYINIVKKDLSRLGIEVIPIPICADIDLPVCGHGDMLLHPLGRGVIGVYAPIFDEFSKRAAHIGAKFVPLDIKLLKKYPGDIALNFLFVNNILIGKMDMLPEFLRDHYIKRGTRFVNVNQGYARCSSLLLSDRAVVTADPSIYRALDGFYIDVLKINNIEIELPGYGGGFIGGCGGLISSNRFYLNGIINNSAENNKIINFAKEHMVEVISNNNEKSIIDVGGIVPLI